MRKLVDFVASSLDGFIATRDGSIGAFPQTKSYLGQIAEEGPETRPTPLRAALGIDATGALLNTVVMGRGTDEPALRLGITSPYAHVSQVAFGRSLTPGMDPAVSFVAGDPVPVVQRLKADPGGKTIWLCGGSDLAAQLVDEIDEPMLKLNPIVLAEGRPLFDGPVVPRRVVLVENRPLNEGVILLRYAPT